MTTPRRKEDDNQHGTLSIEEIAAEAHKHRPHLNRHRTSPVEACAAEPPSVARSKDPPIKTALSQRQQQSRPQQEDPPHFSVLEEHDDYDDDLLHRAVADAGRWAYGTVLVEVWVKHKTSLIRPTSGWWLDPVYHSQPCDKLTCQICRLTDATRPDYERPTALVPGEGLPGVLWAELAGTSRGTRVVLTNNGRNISSTGKNTGLFGRILQQHQDKCPPEDSVGGSSGHMDSNRSPNFWNTSFRASFRSGGGGPSMVPLGKRRGHRRAATSTDDFVSAVAMGSAEGEQGRKQPQLSTGKVSRAVLTYPESRLVHTEGQSPHLMMPFFRQQ
uniref:Uncharacterized protein n=1 Tax=Amphora coffeiformis TaxID=265554 RepID=A0A7S3P9G5_9STRA